MSWLITRWAFSPFVPWPHGVEPHDRRHNVTQELGSARSKPANAPLGNVFAQSDAESVTACDQYGTNSLRARFPAIAAMLEAAQADLTAFAPMPLKHWRKVWSNNPIERANREIKHRNVSSKSSPTATA